MTENSKVNLVLYIETLNLKGLENLTEMWMNEYAPKAKPNCSWCEQPEQFLERKQFILLLLISKKLDIYEEEYPLSDI